MADEKNTAIRTVMTRAPGETAGGHRVFQLRDDDRDEVVYDLAIADERFGDLGEPAQVTVTIEPGDLLNREPREIEDALLPRVSLTQWDALGPKAQRQLVDRAVAFWETIGSHIEPEGVSA